MQIPQYAKHIERHKLVNFFCKSSCKKMRWGEVSKSSWQGDGTGIDHDLYVTCLRCLGRQFDKSNWIRI
jgi:hypothetical protein